MAIRYSPLDLEDRRLFGVSLTGTVGRTDKTKLLDLAEKCLDRGKLLLILDLGELSAIGGGGAKILADFQARLVAAEGEAVFVGAGSVVRQFLTQKFVDLPLRFFPTVRDAETHFDDPDYTYDPDTADASPSGTEVETAGDSDETEPPAGSEAVASGDDDAVMDESDEVQPAEQLEAVDGEGLAAMNEVLEEFNGSDEDEPEVVVGRRKDHRYTSLGEAMNALSRWSRYDGQAEFAVALRNLLFSHGLAEDVILLTAQDDLMIDDSQRWAIARDGSVAGQVAAAIAPLTMLDVQDSELSEAESDLLEELTPTLLLPVMRADRLEAIILLIRNEGDEEYSVAEHFALDLLMHTMAGERPDTRRNAPQPTPAKEPAPTSAVKAERDEPAGRAWQTVATADSTTSDVLLNLALNLPEADDRPHFWRLFARHVWPVLPVNSLGFLAPGMHRAQIIAGDSDHWKNVQLGEEKLRHFFRTMQKPVMVSNLPAFFQETKESLQSAGADWIIGLSWDQGFLGTVFIGSDQASVRETGSEDLLGEIFTETSRLLHRFENNNDSADISLEIARILIAQREKRCYKGETPTDDVVSHLQKLARVMGFAPDQERDLIYGCLLRDIGLLDKDDALMGSTDKLDPTQWPPYRQHTVEGAALLTGLNLPQAITDVVMAHHEQFDGKGFPKGLAGRKIPLAARVVAVVEAYVSMVTGARGRRALTPDMAAAALRKDNGQRFDPDVVAVFLKATLPEDPHDAGSTNLADGGDRRARGGRLQRT